MCCLPGLPSPGALLAVHFAQQTALDNGNVKILKIVEEITLKTKATPTAATTTTAAVAAPAAAAVAVVVLMLLLLLLLLRLLLLLLL